jgi:uncharacterized glyoxalase superfamily protein PhnB
MSKQAGPKPYIFSKGSALKHIEFMETHFHGKCDFKMMRRDDTSQVEHASVTVFGGPVFVSDRFNGQYGAPPEDFPSSRGCHLCSSFETFEAGDKAWNDAIKGGCTVIMPFAPQVCREECLVFANRTKK